MQYGTIIVGVAGWTMHIPTATCRLQERNIKINKFKIHFLTLDVFPLFCRLYTQIDLAVQRHAVIATVYILLLFINK